MLRPDAAESYSFPDKAGAEKEQEQLNGTDELETDSTFYSVVFSYFHGKKTASKGDRIGFSAQRFEGVLTAALTAEAFGSAVAADAQVNRAQTRHMRFSPRRQIARGRKVATELTGYIILYMCEVFNHKTWELSQSI